MEEDNSEGKKLAGSAALLSAALASVCCIGPLIAAGLGLGGLGLAAGLARYRPWFLFLTGAVLAAGFYTTYRKRPIACGDGRCELRSGSQRAKAALWAVAVVAAALATFPSWSSRVLARGPAVVPAGARTLRLKIAGMDCAACVAAIEKAVEKVPGVYSARVGFDQAQAVVITDGKTNPEAVVAAVQTAGYQAAVVGGGVHGEP